MNKDLKIMSSDWYRKHGKLETFNNPDHKVSIAVKYGVNKAIKMYNHLNKLGIADSFRGFDVPATVIGKQVVPILKHKGVPCRLVDPRQFKKSMAKATK